ncbi:MAG: hypothetical protein EOO96_19015 [Pedobacter sp.]|nr:MAG: hypothetical protein EOO96_19015 [Pedobacter sp.]
MISYLKKYLIVTTCLAIILITSCKKSVIDEPVVEKKGIQLFTNAQFGALLTDKEGKTLYFFANDVNGTANCTGGCEAVWPLYYSADASTDLNLDKSRLETASLMVGIGN